jgi:hypothetical protein
MIIMIEAVITSRIEYRITRHNGFDIKRMRPCLKRMRKITAEHHQTYYYGEYSHHDVWTEDGWLVISVFGEDGLQSGIRKGTAVGFVHFAPETPLYVDVSRK